VVGLGNPGRQYEKTRHNVGFRVLDELRRRWGLGQGRAGFQGLLWQTRVARADQRAKVTLLAPMTYMNLSGRSVGELAAFYRALPPDVLVVLDDMALALGRLRARADGSAGGHNGLIDVLSALGTNEVPRLRIGIGAPVGFADPKDYVLSVFRPDELEAVEQAIRLAAEAVEDWVFHGIEYVMSKYNRKDDNQASKDET